MKVRPGRAGYHIKCPACGIEHLFKNDWSFNNDINRPTFKPSLRIALNDYVCHFNVRDGQIHFCQDSTHALKGQTVPLPNIV